MSNQNLTKQNATTPDKSYRIIAILIALASVVAFFLPLKVWTNGAVANKALFGIIAEMSKSNYKMYGVLPILGNSVSALNRLSSYVSYAFIFALVAAFVCAVIGICYGKKSDLFAKLATYCFTWAAAGYSLTVLTITSYVNTTVIRFDISTLVLAIFGAIVYFVIMYKALGKKAWIGAGQFVAALVVLAMVLLAITHNGAIVALALNQDMAFKTYLALGIFTLMILLAVQTLFVVCEKNVYVNLVTALLQAIVVLTVVVVAQVAKINDKNYAIYSLVAAIFAFLQILFACLLTLKANKVAARKEVDAYIGELGKDEYVEVYPYDGTAVQGLYVAEIAEEPATETVPEAEESPVEEVAEETENTEATEESPAEEAEATEATEEAAAEGTPTVIEKVFDPFLEVLTDEEKKQFIDLYILKTENMPEIPTYQVGGNNQAFFRKVFIYIGQYREKIPSDLLAKMYEFSMKI